MKIRLICTISYDNQPNVTVEVTTDAVVLSEVLEAIDKFLKAAGFSYDGRLDIVEEDE